MLEKLSSIESKLDLMRGDYIKIMFALLAVAGASIGTKFISSPFHIIFLSWAAIFAVVFVLCSVYWAWLKLSWPRRLLRLGFCTLIGFSCLVRLFVYEWGTVSPVWFSPLIDLGYVLVCGLLIWSAWNNP